MADILEEHLTEELLDRLLASASICLLYTSDAADE